jgi:hypothetical protein
MKCKLQLCFLIPIKKKGMGVLKCDEDNLVKLKYMWSQFAQTKKECD